jgi:hypothetical protein
MFHSLSFSMCCLHETFHPQFCVHVLLHQSLLSPPPIPHILLHHLSCVFSSCQAYPTFLIFSTTSQKTSCSVYPTYLFLLNCISVLSTFLDGQTLVAVVFCYFSDSFFLSWMYDDGKLSVWRILSVYQCVIAVWPYSHITVGRLCM